MVIWIHTPQNTPDQTTQKKNKKSDRTEKNLSQAHTLPKQFNCFH